MRRSTLTRALVPLAIVASMGLAACSSGGDAAGTAEGPLSGKTIGVAVSGTQNFWDREVFESAIAEVESLGGIVVQTDGGQDTNVHADNHEIFLSQQVDAVITILGDDAVAPKIKALDDAGIPVFGVDAAYDSVINNVQIDNEEVGSEIARILGDHLGGTGQVAVFNGLSEQFSFCGQRYDGWKNTLTAEYPEIEILQPELKDGFNNTVEDARQQTVTLLERYPEGAIDAIHVACWDQPALGVIQGIEEKGRGDVVSTAIDALPEIRVIMQEENSPHIGDIAQQPRKSGALAAQNVAKFFTDGEVEAISYVEVLPVVGAEGAQAVTEELEATGNVQ